MPSANNDAGITRAQAAYLLQVPPATISMWALRGFVDLDGTRRALTVVGRGTRGERLYRYGDLIDAERATRNNPNSRRGSIRANWAEINRKPPAQSFAA